MKTAFLLGVKKHTTEVHREKDSLQTGVGVEWRSWVAEAWDKVYRSFSSNFRVGQVEQRQGDS